MSSELRVEVCYALPEAQTLIEVRVPAGSTVRDALTASGIAERHPEIDLAKAKVGIYGKLKSLDTPLADHDRVEIYRALIVDPKVSRQRRVEKTRREGSIEGRKWLPKDSR